MNFLLWICFWCWMFCISTAFLVYLLAFLLQAMAEVRQCMERPYDEVLKELRGTQNILVV